MLVFASYAEALGKGEVVVELPAGATAADCLAAVRSLPGLERVRSAPLVAVNRRYARADQRLAQGDEVALIPPVAGG